MPMFQRKYAHVSLTCVSTWRHKVKYMRNRTAVRAAGVVFAGLYDFLKKMFDNRSLIRVADFFFDHRPVDLNLTLQ